MTDLTSWFRYQLTASADGLEWAYRQIPARLHEELPPDPDHLGTWSPARHVWHVTEYERCLAIPAMTKWLAGPPQPQEDWPDDDEAWARVQARDADELIEQFRRIRQQQIALLDRYAPEDWSTLRATGWGPKPLAMVVTKTFQHTYEHGDTLLRMGLWWEHILKEIAKATGQTV